MRKTELRDLILPLLDHDACCRPGACLCNAQDNTERIIDLICDPGPIAKAWEDYDWERMLGQLPGEATSGEDLCDVCGLLSPSHKMSCSKTKHLRGATIRLSGEQLSGAQDRPERA